MKGVLRTGDLAPELIHQRELRGWSGDELAKRVGVHPGTISKIEHGQSPGIASATLSALVVAMGEDSRIPLLRAAGVLHDPDPLTTDVLRDLERRWPTWSPHKQRAYRHLLRVLEHLA